MSSNTKKKKIISVVRFVLLLLLAIAMMLPLVVILSSSFKTEVEIFDFPFKFIPKNPVTYNFTQLKENFPT